MKRKLNISEWAVVILGVVLAVAGGLLSPVPVYTLGDLIAVLFGGVAGVFVFAYIVNLALRFLAKRLFKLKEDTRTLPVVFLIAALVRFIGASYMAGIISGIGG